jgi:hypothetical protein
MALFGVRFRTSHFRAFGLIAGVTITNLSARVAQADAMSQKEKEKFCVFLPPENRALLAEHVDKKLGIKPMDLQNDEKEALGREIVLKLGLNDIDSYIYRPLYGERAAFRLKGLITTAEGDVIGTGRVSNLAGELFDEEYEASILLKTNVSASEAGRAQREMLMDLPTRLYQAGIKADINRPWKGSVRNGEVLGRNYAAKPGLTVRALTPDEQIVIDGRVCSDLYADIAVGKCTFDRAMVVDEKPPAGLEERTINVATHENKVDLQRRRDDQQRQENPPQPTASTNSEVSSTQSPEQAEKCPVCRYMKGGPCKAEFIAWDVCINNLKEDQDVRVCYEATAQMMACMQQHEYYDPMTSNTKRTS